jgi:hypothetical protein
MIIDTVTWRRPNLSVLWPLSSNEITSYYLANYISNGRLLKIEVRFSEDNLTKTRVFHWASNADLDEFKSNIDVQRYSWQVKEYCNEQNIQATKSLIEN